MLRKIAIAVAATLVAASVPTGANADGGEHKPAPAPARFAPGAAGVGDSYFPLDGNGGYDVGHYDLDITYDPATDVLRGTATISARATQGLSAFNLDLEGLTVRFVKVDYVNASFTRSGTS